MKIGGEVERLLFLRDLEDLKGDLPSPLRILGNGSNVLIDDQGLRGSVIVVRDFPPKEPEILSQSETQMRIQVSAGVFLPALSRWTAKQGFSGCEYMIGVPGTLGGAIVQNAGANDQEMKGVLESLRYFDIGARKLHEISANECGLDYRDSAFKHWPHRLIVSAILKLTRGSAEAIEAQTELNLKYRKEKTPYTKASLGSIYTRIRQGDQWIFPGKLIEDAGLKGHRIGGASVSVQHANYIVNEGSASFDDVIELMRFIEARVFENAGIRLQREILIWSDRNFETSSKNPL